MKKTGLRIGKVSSINYETGMVQVVYKDKGNAVTAEMPYANFNDEYHMPEIGEGVLVGHLSNGSSRGVVLGTIWSRKNMPAEYGEGVYRKEFSKKKGAAYARFDDADGEYLIRAPGILLHGVDHMEVEAPEIRIAANIKTELESPRHIAMIGQLSLSGFEEGGILVTVTDDIKVIMGVARMEALIASVRMEAVEGMEISAGGLVDVKADGLGIEVEGISMKASGDIRMEDGRFKGTFSEIMERLEALDGNRSARK